MKAPMKAWTRRLCLLVPLSAWMSLQSCITDNQATYQGLLGETRQPTEPELSGGSGGSGGAGGTTTTTGSGGSRAEGGEAGAGQAGEGGADETDGNAGSSSGGSGASGTTGLVDPDSPYWPPCSLGLSQSGEEIKKGTPCTQDDPQLCYRECGPYSVGWKTETCLASVYAEGDCTFPPDQDYSCFKIPDVIDETLCKVSAPPRATEECDAPVCYACNYGGQYFDTGDNVKDGYCVCREPDENGIRMWTCASTTAWPCPFSQGC